MLLGSIANWYVWLRHKEAAFQYRHELCPTLSWMLNVLQGLLYPNPRGPAGGISAALLSRCVCDIDKYFSGLWMAQTEKFKSVVMWTWECGFLSSSIVESLKDASESSYLIIIESPRRLEAYIDCHGSAKQMYINASTPFYSWEI